jgi:hypothetical protein
MIDYLDTLLKSATQEVFTTMLNFQFEPVSHTDRCAVSFRCGDESVLMGVIIKKTA